MAAGDYYSCDVCSSKTFYDANLNYELSTTKHPIPKEECMSGENYRVKLDYCGDIRAICLDCAKTHEIIIKEKE